MAESFDGEHLVIAGCAFHMSFFDWEEAWSFIEEISTSQRISTIAQRWRTSVNLRLNPEQWNESDLIGFVDRRGSVDKSIAHEVLNAPATYTSLAVQQRIWADVTRPLELLSTSWYKDQILTCPVTQCLKIHPQLISDLGLIEDIDVVRRLVMETRNRRLSGYFPSYLTRQMSVAFLERLAQDPDPVVQDFAINVFAERNVLDLFEAD